MSTCLLLSGGMDSIAIAYWKRPEFAITVDYGQKAAAAEIRAAAVVCNELNITHCQIHANLASLGSGDMANSPAHPCAPVSEWWPFRNQMLVTLAAMKGVALGVNKILIGCLITDSLHADGRYLFVKEMDQLLSNQEGAIRLDAPAIEMTAVELVRRSGVPISILAWSHSCHVSEHACGLCRGCRKHYETLQELGLEPY